MTEQDVKLLCKCAIENGQRRLTPTEKELLKKGIDDAKSFQARLSCGGVGGNGYQLKHVLDPHAVQPQEGKASCVVYIVFPIFLLALTLFETI